MPTSQGFRGLRVYQLAFNLAMEIFKESKKFPLEEPYSLTNQIRRASRSVASNIGEAYRKKRYPKVFVNKLSDADGEERRLRSGSTSRKRADISQRRYNKNGSRVMKK